MSRKHRLGLIAGRALYDQTLQVAAVAFGEQRYRDALGVYERFLAEHPGVHTTEIEHRVQVLKSYIEEHIEGMPGTEDSAQAAQDDVVLKRVPHRIE